MMSDTASNRFTLLLRHDQLRRAKEVVEVNWLADRGLDVVDACTGGRFRGMRRCKTLTDAGRHPRSSAVTSCAQLSGGTLFDASIATHSTFPVWLASARAEVGCANARRVRPGVSQASVVPPPASILSVAAKRDDSCAPCVTLSQAWKAKPALIVPSVSITKRGRRRPNSTAAAPSSRHARLRIRDAARRPIGAPLTTHPRASAVLISVTRVAERLSEHHPFGLAANRGKTGLRGPPTQRGRAQRQADDHEDSDHPDADPELRRHRGLRHHLGRRIDGVGHRQHVRQQP